MCLAAFLGLLDISPGQEATSSSPSSSSSSLTVGWTLFFFSKAPRWFLLASEPLCSSKLPSVRTKNLPDSARLPPKLTVLQRAFSSSSRLLATGVFNSKVALLPLHRTLSFLHVGTLQCFSASSKFHGSAQISDFCICRKNVQYLLPNGSAAQAATKRQKKSELLQPRQRVV